MSPPRTCTSGACLICGDSYSLFFLWLSPLPCCPPTPPHPSDHLNTEGLEARTMEHLGAVASVAGSVTMRTQQASVGPMLTLPFHLFPTLILNANPWAAWEGSGTEENNNCYFPPYPPPSKVSTFNSSTCAHKEAGTDGGW